MADIWFDVDTALAEVPVNIFPLTDDTDFKTREASVAYNATGMDLVWNFVTTAGAYTQTAVTPTTGGAYDWAHQGDGMYSIEIPASGGASINNDTEGFGWFTGMATGVLPWRSPVFGFRAAGINNKLIDDAYDTTRGLAGTALPAAAADAAGGLPISDAGGLDLDTILARITDARMGALTDWINGGRLDNILDAIAADVAGLDGAAMRGTDGAALASAWTATRAGYIDLLNTYLDAAITSRSSHSAADVWAVTTRTLSSFGTLVSDITTAVWSAGTRTLSGFGSLIADIWNYATRALTDKAGFTISGTKQTLDALNDMSSSTVRAQADAALAAYDAPTKAELDAAVAPLATSVALSAVDDYIDTEVTAIKAVTDKLDTAMEADGGVYRFTANALEEGPSGTSGGGDATAANQATIIAHLTDIKGTGFSGATDSLKAIRDRGDSAWITGSGLSGSNAVVINVHDDDGANIVEAAVEIWDSAGTTFYERKTSDSSGQVAFNMDDGTYTVKIHKAGYSIANQVLIVPDTLNPVYVMTAFVIGTPSDPNLCRIYIDIANIDGTIPATLTRSIEVISLPAEIDSKYLTDTDKNGTYDATTGRLYFDAIREATVRIKIEVCNIDQTGEVPDKAEATLSEVVFT